MYKKLKAFIGVALVALPLFMVPVGIFLNPHTESGPVLAVQPAVAFAETECVEGLINVNITICVADLLEFAIFTPALFLASITGRSLDFFVEYSITSSTYSQGSDFVHRGWALVRDIVNIFFIFVLLYIAIGTILNLSQVNTKKMLVRVIIVALLINFSLFFTKIIIDTSNILSRAFINSIQINVIGEDGQPVQSGTKQLSAAIVSQFEPQKLLDEGEGSVYYNYAQENAEQAGFLRIVMLLSGSAILLYMCWIFLTTGFLFLSRVITLWLVMITAPIAFISIVLPFNIPKLGHKEWTKKLFESAFMAPIFLFFMYLLVMFLDLGFFDNVSLGSGTGFAESILRILIPFAIVMGLVVASTKIAKSMSGEVGAAISKFGGAAMGLAAAAATGGTAMMGRMALGGAGSRIAASGRLKDIALGKSESRFTNNAIAKYGARAIRGVGKGAASASYDPRQIAGVQKAMKEMGLNQYGTGALGMATTKGGYNAARQRYLEKQQKRAADYEVSEDEGTMQKLRSAENSLTKFENENKHIIDSVQKNIDDAREALNDAKGGDPDIENEKRILLETAKGYMKDLKEGREFAYTDSNGDLKISDGLKQDGKTYKQLKNEKSTRELEVTQASNARREALAQELTGTGAQVVTAMKSIAAGLAGYAVGGKTGAAIGMAGTASGETMKRREAAYQTRQGKKTEKKTES